jgi:hypothetical protein
MEFRRTEFQCRASVLSFADGEEAPLETLTDTLMKRVDELVQPSKPELEWGSPLLSTTPTSIAIHELAVRTEALANAVREIALEVHKLSAPT